MALFKTLSKIIVQAVILVPLISPVWSGPPVMEDLPADTSTTQKVTVGSFETGVFEQARDVDWMKVSLEANTTYLIKLFSDTLPLLSLSILNPDNPSASPLFNNRNKAVPPYEASIVFTPLVNGDYYLSLAADNKTSGYYIVSVEVLARSVPLPPPAGAGVYGGGWGRGGQWPPSGPQKRSRPFPTPAQPPSKPCQHYGKGRQNCGHLPEPTLPPPSVAKPSPMPVPDKPGPLAPQPAQPIPPVVIDPISLKPTDIPMPEKPCRHHGKGSQDCGHLPSGTQPSPIPGYPVPDKPGPFGPQPAKPNPPVTINPILVKPTDIPALEKPHPSKTDAAQVDPNASPKKKRPKVDSDSLNDRASDADEQKSIGYIAPILVQGIIYSGGGMASPAPSAVPAPLATTTPSNATGYSTVIMPDGSWSSAPAMTAVPATVPPEASIPAVNTRATETRQVITKAANAQASEHSDVINTQPVVNSVVNDAGAQVSPAIDSVKSIDAPIVVPQSSSADGSIGDSAQALKQMTNKEVSAQTLTSQPALAAPEPSPPPPAPAPEPSPPPPAPAPEPSPPPPAPAPEPSPPPPAPAPEPSPPPPAPAPEPSPPPPAPAPEPSPPPPAPAPEPSPPPPAPAPEPSPPPPAPAPEPSPPPPAPAPEPSPPPPAPAPEPSPPPPPPAPAPEPTPTPTP